MSGRSMTVVAIPEKGKVRWYPSIRACSRATGHSYTSLLRLLFTGDDMDGYEYQWGCEVDDEDIARCEAYYLTETMRRREYTRDYKRRMRDAQENLQDVRMSGLRG